MVHVREDALVTQCFATRTKRREGRPRKPEAAFAKSHCQ
uniref:Uncharacterized protein n=1 Tax=Amycolatopsis orientalis subsp. vinearia TaxID=797057 RepID=A0A023GXM1_AMYOR|nr:hypothetical protein [Amycolatopsis orientalis subsp. vinearia]